MWIPLLGAAAAIGTAAAFGLYGVCRSGLPQVEGTLEADGLVEPVRIDRDSFGVPHIRATCLEDAVFAQGFVHAQDRIWQMELNRRVGQGRLAELFGERALGADFFLRRLGLRKAARADEEALEPEERRLLESYCAGVNRGIAAYGWRLPPEFWMLWLRPEPWTPLDCLTWIQIMSMDLATNWQQELLRGQVLGQLEPEQAAAIHLQHSGSPSVLPDEPAWRVALDGLVEQYHEAKGYLPNGGAPGASNAWVVSGERSRSGAPLLAADPHLVGRVPGIWYEVRLECPGLNCSGVTLAGFPLVIIGRNADVAWGVTNAYADTEDLFLERFESPESNRYETEDGWREAEIVEEWVMDSSRGQHVEHVLSTRHGPVLFRGEEYGLALKSVSFHPSHPVRTLLAMNRATNAEEFHQALRGWQIPASNFIFADRHGSIAYCLAGEIPMRKRGNGLTPVPGWSGEYEWVGAIPFEELPFVKDPECGYLISANNPAVGGDFAHFLSWDWLSGARAERIEELVTALESATADDFRAFQLDTECLVGARFAALCCELDIPARGSAVRALEILRAWEGDGGPDSVGMAIYQTFSLALARELLTPHLGPHLTLDFLGASHNPISLTAGHTGRSTVWLLQLLSEPARLETVLPLEELPGCLGRAFRKAVTELEKRLGREMDSWTWGRLHSLTFEHPLGSLGLLGRFFNGPTVEIGGDTDTVCQTAVDPVAPYTASSWCPSFRQVVDLAEDGEHQTILPTGQSGHPLSPHYLDQFTPWLEGRLKSKLGSEGQPGSTLRLEPKRAAPSP